MGSNAKIVCATNKALRYCWKVLLRGAQEVVKLVDWVASKKYLTDLKKRDMQFSDENIFSADKIIFSLCKYYLPICFLFLQYFQGQVLRILFQ